LLKFRRIAETEIFSGSLVRLSRAQVEGPQGEVFEREIVHHPGAVVVVPLAGGGSDPPVLLVRQYRAAIGSDLLELPAGKRDKDGEAPQSTAERELVEELGRRPRRLELLSRFYNSPGFCDELSWLFLASDLEEVADCRQGPEERHMTVEEMALSTAVTMAAKGEITDAKTIIGLLLAARTLATG
jgi:8-oxo-dGTP pyrophosphatase MutT (NUDIX family)